MPLARERAWVETILRLNFRHLGQQSITRWAASWGERRRGASVSGMTLPNILERSKTSPVPCLARALATGLLLLLAAASGAAQSRQDGDWPAYGRDRGGERFSPLTGITRENVGRLAVAWEYSTGEAALSTGNATSFEATPLVLDGVMYLSTPLGKVVALDAETGRERWVADLRVDRARIFGDFTTRGVALWADPAARAGAGCALRVIVATIDARLFALDATSGRPCPGFGSQGSVDLRTGLRNPPDETEEYEVTSPPAIAGDLIVVGSAVADNNRTDAASGEGRALDIRTGRGRGGRGAGGQGSGRPGVARRERARGAPDRRRQRLVGDRGGFGAGARLRPDVECQPRLLGRGSQGGEPLRQFDRGSSLRDRQGGLALPDGPPRPLGLRQRLVGD